VFCRVADDRDDHGSDEELRQVGAAGESVDRPDERRGHEGGDQRGDGEHANGSAERPTSDLNWIGRRLKATLTSERLAIDEDAHGEQCDGDWKGQHRQRVPVRVPSGCSHRGNEQEQHGHHHGSQRDEGRGPIELARSGDQKSEAQHEQQVPDDGSRERGPHDVGQPVGDGDERDDQLRCVAEARVQETADPGPGVVGGLLGGLADKPRERNQRGGGKHEQDEIAGQAEEVENDHDGSRREKRREESRPSGW